MRENRKWENLYIDLVRMNNMINETHLLTLIVGIAAILIAEMLLNFLSRVKEYIVRKYKEWQRKRKGDAYVVAVDSYPFGVRRNQ